MNEPQASNNKRKDSFSSSDGEIRAPIDNTWIKQKKKGELIKKDDRNYKEEMKKVSRMRKVYTTHRKHCIIVYEVDNVGSAQCALFCGHRALLPCKRRV